MTRTTIRRGGTRRQISRGNRVRREPAASVPFRRVVIEGVQPEIGAGQVPIKRTPGEPVVVTANIYADGHDQLAAVLRFRDVKRASWQEVSMQPLGNDRWMGQFTVTALGHYEYTVLAWIDRFGSWRQDLTKKWAAGQRELTSDLLEGAQLLGRAAQRASQQDAQWLRNRAQALTNSEELSGRIEAALDPKVAEVMGRYQDRRNATSYERALGVTVERDRARFGSWYEMFPRSAGTDPTRSATLREAEARLPGIAAMGFDVLYLPPIHPIGKTSRKGPNNTLEARAHSPGSPWAIGSPEGGHKAIEPRLGTLKDFAHFVATARRLGLEIALDLAFHCSPDHPYVQEHPEWFRHRPDGSIKYAENPPKKYQDIYPFDFECTAWRGLWEELKGIVDFWIAQGVRIFRADNPHTKPFAFWEWLIRKVQGAHPDTIFLAEAFTRPTIMQHLATCGFSQSYTYFTWRNTKTELTEYFTGLTQTEMREYLRPNLFANTPDILHEYLQVGGRPAFQIRLVLAATLGANYGIYGPAFELCETRAVPGTEEYQDSEKYQIRQWDWDRPGHIKALLTRVNQIRRENPALQFHGHLRFYQVDNPQLICYSKILPDLSNAVIVVVNLDPHHTQSGWVWIPVGDLGLQPTETYQVHDLLSDARYLWKGESHFVQLDPGACPAHIFRVRRRLRTERDFDYFM